MPLEYPSLVWIAGLKGRSGGTRNVSYPDYLVYRDRATTLSGVAAYGGTAMSVGGRQPQRVLGGLVSGNYFDVLGIRVQIGRTFASNAAIIASSPVNPCD